MNKPEAIMDAMNVTADQMRDTKKLCENALSLAQWTSKSVSFSPCLVLSVSASV